MLSFAGKALVLGLLAAVLPVVSPATQGNLRSAGNSQFEVVGFDARSVSFVDDLSRHVAEIFERHLRPDSLQFPQRILVSLRPEEFVDFGGDYRIRIRDGGFVDLDLRWEPSLSLRSACHALSEALLLRYAIYFYGRSAPERVPEWLASALGTRTYLSLRPAEFERISDWMDPGKTPSLAQLLGRKWTEPVGDANGFLLLLAIESTGVKRNELRALLEQSLSGKDIVPALATLVESVETLTEPRTLDDWWQASVDGLMAPQEEFMETMETSRRWIQALADFSAVEGRDLNIADLWNQRESEKIRDLVGARYEILRVRILQVNPAYFNAARSLGALFETYLEGDAKRHQYIHQLAVYLSDFEDNKRLEQVVNEALGKTGPESLRQ